MNTSVIVQSPTGDAAQLLLLFHGWGATPASLILLAKRLSTDFPAAMIVCIQAPHPSDSGKGLQWFSAVAVGDHNRATRVGEALPEFVATVRAWQAPSGVSANATALIGFSQGAIMALEASQIYGEGKALLAGRVVSIGGRYATIPTTAPVETTLHFIHGKADTVIAYGIVVEAAETLIALSGDVTADIIPFLGHAITAPVEELVCERLKTYAPKRIWEAALRAEAQGNLLH